MLLTKIQSELKEALLAQETSKVSCLRLLLSDIHNLQIEKQGELADEDVIAVIRRGLKQRQESIIAYQKGNRADLEQKEKLEAEILSKYLPQEIPPKELEKIVNEVISQTGASELKDFGKVMGAVMAKVKGLAEGNQVSQIVKKQLEIFS